MHHGNCCDTGHEIRDDPFAGSYAAFPERMSTASGIDSAGRRNQSTSVPEWEAVEKKSDRGDLTAFVTEMALGRCPRMPIPNHFDCYLSSVSRTVRKKV